MRNLKHPKELVAKVLGISEEQLNENSCYGETPNWDSLCHVEIINELEISYGIQISNADIERYLKFKAIIELYENLIISSS